MNTLQAIPQDLQDFYIVRNFNQITDKYKCYQINIHIVMITTKGLSKLSRVKGLEPMR